MSDRQDIIGELLPPERLMLTPGPSCVDLRVYRAMAAPLVGHMDPWFTGMMDDVQTLLRQVFRTQNRITFPISAPGPGGSSGCHEPAGNWRRVHRMRERRVFRAHRHHRRAMPAKVTRVEAPYGRTSIRRTFFAPAR